MIPFFGKKDKDGQLSAVEAKIKKEKKFYKRSLQTRRRIGFFIFCFFCLYGVLAAQLVYYGMREKEDDARRPTQNISATRPDIVDRNGLLLATDMQTYSLFAEPRRIVDADETLEMLKKVLPHLDIKSTYKKLKSGAGFAWIERGLTSEQKSQIMAMGIPGVDFITETKRYYPASSIASHILGFVNIDNHGIAGMERYIDKAGLSDLRSAGFTDGKMQDKVKLSIDLRVQTIVHDELQKAMQRYRAVGAGAAVIDIHTGEVVAMASVPDFDPNNPVSALQKDRLNRMSAGVYEMGSTIKIFTTAMALDSGFFKLNSIIDASKPLPAGGGRFIHDFHGKYRPLTTWEVFIYSSNIGSAKEALAVGISGHRAFLKRLGLLDRMNTELPEVARPVEPRTWKNVHSMTIAFGHGISTTPLQTAAGAAALVNGGKLIHPTFLKRNPQSSKEYATQVIKPQTSLDMRYLFKLNSDIGSGRRAKVEGYRVGGKTGTAEKVVNGRYSKDKRFNAFVAAFPIDNPQYIVLTIIDEPKPEEGQKSATAGLNAAPMVANIIRRSATFLGIKPDFQEEYKPVLASRMSLPETSWND